VWTNTSALAFGGLLQVLVTAVTESWNGTSWTELNDLNTARDLLGGAGNDNTSALAFGGDDPVSQIAVILNLWNGTSWTEVE
jgi:hypothetical protein